MTDRERTVLTNMYEKQFRLASEYRVALQGLYSEINTLQKEVSNEPVRWKLQSFMVKINETLKA